MILKMNKLTKWLTASGWLAIFVVTPLQKLLQFNKSYSFLG